MLRFAHSNCRMNVFPQSCHLSTIASIPFGFQTSCSSTNFEKSPRPTNSSAYTTGFRYVGIRKIMTFLGLPQIFVSVVFVGVFISAIVVFALGISVVVQLHFTAT